MFGLSERPLGSETGLLPPTSKAGITIMSVNLLLPNEDDAVIWRGPLIGKVITQFWEEVLWGKLDYLLVDLPPGTADAPLTVMQTLPLSGVIIVFTPQDLAAMVVRKAMQMADKMNVPIKGVVENMSYFLIPDSGKRIEIFGKSNGQQMANAAGAPLLGQFPIDPQLAQLCDEGSIESYYSEELERFTEALLKAM
jgi:hydrogenase maturation protease